MNLENFVCEVSEDSVKSDLELVCRECDAVICDVEAGDSLGLLVRTVSDHLCEGE